MPTTPSVWWVRESSFSSVPTSCAPSRDQGGHRDHHAGVAEREPEPDRDRPLAVGHQLAGGVVDRGDVVGVEGVPHTKRVRGHPKADPERLGTDLVVPRHHEQEQDAERHHVQRGDHSQKTGGTDGVLAPPTKSGGHLGPGGQGHTVTLQHLVDHFVKCRGRSPGLRVRGVFRPGLPVRPGANSDRAQLGRKLPDHSGEGRSGLNPPNHEGLSPVFPNTTARSPYGRPLTPAYLRKIALPPARMASMHLVPAERADRRAIDGHRVCDAVAAIGEPRHLRAWAERSPCSPIPGASPSCWPCARQGRSLSRTSPSRPE